MQLIESINRFLWNGPVLILLCATHLLFTIRLKLPQKHTLRAIRLSVTPEQETGKSSNTKNLSGFATLATTLAATLGTGNIVGVSTAIALGGPGALFWCWITGIFGMATAYAECYLSVLYRHRQADGTYTGGPMYVLEKGLGSKALGRFYALCVLFAAFGVGCTTQASAIADAAKSTWNLPAIPVGILTAMAAGFVIVGGIKAIGNFCTRLVPFLGFCYIGSCLVLMWMNRAWLLQALLLIMDSAFSPKAAAGGFVGSTFLLSVRFGIARGLFTNEAGIGTAAIAAGAVRSPDPKRQGLISMTAVFWDTVIMCAMTGLIIVANIIRRPASIEGCSTGGLTHAAFSILPSAGPAFLSITLIAFAIATLVGWCYFGEKGAEYLFGKESIRTYQLCYIVMIYVGAIAPLDLVWSVTDLINAVMVFPNVLALWYLRRKII